MPFLSVSSVRCQKFFCALLCITAVFLLFSTSSARAQTFGAESFTLDNGLKVVVIPNHRAPVVSHMLWYKTGAADEPRGKSGIAHFLEHLLFTGTKNIPPDEFSKIVKSHGGQDNAFTAQDYTGYFQNIAVEKLPLVMAMEADRMKNLVLSEELVTRERQVILEERSQRTDNIPAARLGEAVSSALFVNHPYSIPVIGWRHEMEGLSREDALDFYRRHYRPANAILIVAGDITAERLKKLANRYYGHLTNPPQTRQLQRVWPAPAPLEADKRITLRDATVQSPVYQRHYRAPAGSEALEILSDILGEGTTSRLYRALVVEQKVATSAGSSYNAVQRGLSRFALYAVPAPDSDIETVEKALLDEIRKLMSGGITDAELTESKNRLIDSADYARDSLQYPAQVFGRALTAGFDLDYVEYWTERIENISAQDVMEAAQSVFGNGQASVSGILLPAEE
ncbi:MAG: insulinase family protein [Micavibrio sp.]|nr:MAG: insulinase family protein [Micavibrio sp.]